MCAHVCERERACVCEHVCVCVCVCERESERESVCVCERAYVRESVCERVCVFYPGSSWHRPAASILAGRSTDIHHPCSYR